MATRGLVLLAKDTFSAVSSVSFDNVFSANYNQYKIIINISSAAGAYAYMRLRASGTDNTSTDYKRQYIYADSTSIGQARGTADSRWDGIAELNTYANINIIEVKNPFQTAYTSAINAITDASTGNIFNTNIAFGIGVTTSYDGFTVEPNTSTITGTITVYGLAQ